MTTANKLTLSRVAMIPLFIAIMYCDFPGYRYVALGIYVVASITDFVDGYIARHYNQVSNFGKFMDPIADKLLVTAAMLMFVAEGRMPAWVLLAVIAREFAVTGLRLVAVEQGRVIAAGKSGKIKTASTMVCNCIMFLPIPNALNTVCWLVILVTTVYSGVEYFVQNKDCLSFKS